MNLEQLHTQLAKDTKFYKILNLVMKDHPEGFKYLVVVFKNATVQSISNFCMILRVNSFRTDSKTITLKGNLMAVNILEKED